MIESHFTRAQRVATFACLIGLTLAAAGSPAAAQTDSPAEQKAIAHTKDVLNDRNRSTMHSGDALKLIGVEQGGNEIRSHTPALAQSNRVAAQVDTEDSYRRTRAMYDSGSVYHLPLAANTDSGPAPDKTPSHLRSDASAENNGTSQWPWALGFAAACALALWAHNRVGSLKLGKRAPRSKPA